MRIDTGRALCRCGHTLDRHYWDRHACLVGRGGCPCTGFVEADQPVARAIKNLADRIARDGLDKAEPEVKHLAALIEEREAS